MPSPHPDLLRVHPADDVAVALVELTAGTAVAAGGVRLKLREPIPSGHKLALRPIRRGATVHKYGHPIGTATVDIATGAWVHEHNLASALSGIRSFAWQPAAGPAEAPLHAEFDGYRRTRGRAGTRNEIWVLCTVGCVARSAQRIAALGAIRHAGRVDGIHAYTHPFGCSQLGDDLESTRRALAALARHPNVGGLLLVGLGCESNQIAAMLDAVGGIDLRRIRAFNAQSAEDETEQGLALLDQLVEVAAQDRRSRCPLSELAIGLKCGGSDGYSGLTANPLVGRIADRVTAAGGTAILTEIPEVFGAEHLLLQRAVDRGVFDAAVTLVDDFKRYFLDHGQPVNENPSPGNRAGGITTLEEKSLGAVQKGGHAPLTQVLRYGERAELPGLALLEAPGNDAVSSTALTAAGATVLLFTTGRGTPLGFPAPTLKIASNSALAARKPGWIDFDAGRLLGAANPAALADELLARVIATASGRPTCNERNGERDIALWKRGVTL